MRLFGNRERTKEQKLKAKNFKATREVLNFIKFDDVKREILIPKTFGPLFLKYDELVDFKISQVLKDISKQKGGIKRAVLGSIIAGETGALIGALGAKTTTTRYLTEMEVIINSNNKLLPTCKIQIYNGITEYEGNTYNSIINKAKEIIIILNSIVDGKKGDNSLPIDELLKLKELLDLGVLTQEEFDKEKAKILNR